MLVVVVVTEVNECGSCCIMGKSVIVFGCSSYNSCSGVVFMDACK